MSSRVTLDLLRQFGRLFLLLGAAAALTVLMATAVLAAATFDIPVGPTWLNPGYRWTVRVLTISNPDKQVCLDYKETPPGTNTILACTCDNTLYGDCAVGTGDWTCTIPANMPNTSVNWNLGIWSSGGAGLCGALKTPIAQGSFGAGPLALELSRFTGNAGATTGGLQALLALSAAGLLVGELRRRRR